MTDTYFTDEDSDSQVDFQQRMKDLRGKKEYQSSLPAASLLTEQTETPTLENQAAQAYDKHLQREAELVRQKESLKADLLARFSKYNQQTGEPESAAEAEQIEAGEELEEFEGFEETKIAPAAFESSQADFKPEWELIFQTQSALPQNPVAPAPSATPTPPRPAQTKTMKPPGSSLHHRFGLGNLEISDSGQKTVQPTQNERQLPIKELSPEQQQALAEARRVVQAGALIKAVIVKPAASSHGLSTWEMAYRTYDTLKHDLTYYEPLELSFTPTKLINNSFSAQEMAPDLVVGSIRVIKLILEDHTSYEYLQIMTLNQQHTVLLYPISTLSIESNLVTIQFEERSQSAFNHSQSPVSESKISTLLNSAISIGKPLFNKENKRYRFLNLPVQFIEPQFDIEKRIKRGQEVYRSQDVYHLYLGEQGPANQGSDKWQRIKLSLLKRDKIKSYLEKWQETSACSESVRQMLRSVEPYLISSWSQRPGQRWFFSSLFLQADPDRSHYQMLLLLESTDPDQPFLIPFLLDCHWPSDGQESYSTQMAAFEQTYLQRSRYQQLQQQFARQTELLIQPALFFKRVLKYQPVSLAQAELSTCLKIATQSSGLASLKPASEAQKQGIQALGSEWQQFAEACTPLQEVFELLNYLTMSSASEDLLESHIRKLIQNKALSKSVKLQLKQRFYEFRSHNAQAYKHADQEHYILEFWHTFFKLLFQSQEFPESILHLQAYSQPYKMKDAHQNVSLEIFSSQSTQHETVLWVIERQTETNSLVLLDLLLPQDQLGLPQNVQPFPFIKTYQELPESAKQVIKPHWRYFKPLHELSRLS